MEILTYSVKLIVFKNMYLKLRNKRHHMAKGYTFKNVLYFRT